jgi:hypothetical protein
MKLIKLSQYKQETNHIENYFVLDHGGKKSPEVYKFPFFVTSETFRKQLNEQNKNKGIMDFRGNIIHACYDVSSNKLYFPEVSSPEELNAIEKSPIMPSLEITVLKIYKINLSGVKIAGDPYQTFRIRKLGNFASASSFIRKNIISEKVPFNPDFIVIEADLSSMPKTAEFLKIDKNSESCFVNQNRGVVPFIRNVGSKDYLFYTLRGPFILINLSFYNNISDSEKDRIIIEKYKNYVEEQVSTDEIESMDEIRIFNIKYLILLGWSIQQMCQFMINKNTVKNIEDLLTRVAPYLIVACRELERQGYKNPLRDYYYYFIKRSKNFPIHIPISPEIKAFNTDKQHPVIQVLCYDPKEDLVTLRSKLYFSEDICKQVFSTDNVTILTYLADDKKFRSTTNIMSDKKVGNSVKLVVSNVRKDKGFDEKEKFAFEQVTNAIKFYFEKRKVSDFYQAADKIKDICKRMEKTKGEEVKFEDLNVYVGPLSQIAPGMLGGYIDAERCAKRKIKLPIENMIPGIKFYPHDIIIDTSENSSIADVYDKIIHEYTHHINWMTKVKSPEYEMPGNDIKKMLIYLNSPDERESHIQQSMYLLSLGMSKDQIIKRFLNQVPNFNVLSIAKKYNEFIEEAAKRLEKTSETENKEEQQLESTLKEFNNESEIEKKLKMREELLNEDDDENI